MTAAEGSGDRRGESLGWRVQGSDRCLVVEFAAPQRTLSWAIVRGGEQRASRVAWVQVRDWELDLDTDPVALTRRRLEEVGATDAVALLTSSDLEHHVEVAVERGGEYARCMATVGLSNALRAGDPPPLRETYVGTINLLCWTSSRLEREALIEATSIAAEARTLAIVDAGVRSTVSGAPASGTGTDCIVLACPEGGEPQRYAGKHTLTGHLVATAVYRAVRSGAEQWGRRHRAPEDA